MTSAVTLCNAALLQLHADRIDTLTESTENARICNERYEPLRDALLVSHPWNFAQARAELSQSATTPSYGYAYAFDLPGDCLRVLDVDSNYSNLVYKIEKRTLLFDESTVKIRYIQRIEDEDSFPIYFQEALIAKIAADIGYAVTGDLKQAEYFYKLSEEKLSNARTTDGQEGVTTYKNNSPWLDVHDGYTRPPYNINLP